MDDEEFSSMVNEIPDMSVVNGLDDIDFEDLTDWLNKCDGGYGADFSKSSILGFITQYGKMRYGICEDILQACVSIGIVYPVESGKYYRLQK